MKLLIFFLMSFNAFALTPAEYETRFDALGGYRPHMFKCGYSDRNKKLFKKTVIEQDDLTKLLCLESKHAEVQADAATEAAIKSAKEAQACGKDVKAYMLVLNAPKNLSATQVDKFYNDTDLKMIQDQLSGGSLDTARIKMVAYTPDDDPVTDADKTAMIAKLDECK